MRLLSIMSLALATSALPICADAGIKCADTDHILSRLENVFQEHEVAVSETQSGVRLSVFASDESQTWTVVSTFPERSMTCLLASGSSDDPIPDLAEVLSEF